MKLEYSIPCIANIKKRHCNDNQIETDETFRNKPVCRTYLYQIQSNELWVFMKYLRAFF